MKKLSSIRKVVLARLAKKKQLKARPKKKSQNNYFQGGCAQRDTRAIYIPRRGKLKGYMK